MRRLVAPLVALACLLTTTAWADVDVNQASEAQLDSVRGIGPGLSSRILAARAQAPFRDWPDLMQRVSGIGKTTAQRLSDAGLRVNQQTWPSTSAPSAPATPPSSAR